MKKLLALGLLIGCGPVWAQTATDLDCIKCVGTAELAKKAVGTGKIKDGAVTVEKVAPELSNAIGTFCPPGQAVVGMDETGNFVCETFAPEWELFDFPIGGTNVVNDCSLGEKYIKRSDFDPGLFVGAQTCGVLRYKLFLSESMGGPYWEIADGNFGGEDHCELVGGPDATDGLVEESPPLPSGFVRNNRGEPFVFLTPPDNTYFRAPYYECGVFIPAEPPPIIEF